MDNEEKRDQEELDELQEFDLDAILNEFHTDPEDAPPEDAPGIAPETGDIEAFDQELSQILQDFGEEPGEEQPSSLSETRFFPRPRQTRKRQRRHPAQSRPYALRSLLQPQPRKLRNRRRLLPPRSPFPSAVICGN